MASLRGRVVIVTGASSGIGRDTAGALAQRGAKVIAAARNVERLEQLASEAPGIDIAQCDVGVAADRAALVDGVLGRHGRVDGLINNAGVGWNALVEDTPEDKVRELFDVNVVGLIDLTQRVLPTMLGQRDGDIVNVSSIAGYVASPPFTVYAASKHAVTGFTTGLRRELTGTGVHAHLITPGPVRTEWWVRGAGYEPAEGEPEQRHTGSGVPAALVTAAILRCLTRPTRRVVSVPRVFGFARIAEVPLIRYATDLVLSGYVRGTRRP